MILEKIKRLESVISIICNQYHISNTNTELALLTQTIEHILFLFLLSDHRD